MTPRPPAAGSSHTLGGAALLLLALGGLVAVQRRTGLVTLATYPGVLLNNWLLPLGTGWLLRGLCAART